MPGEMKITTAKANERHYKVDGMKITTAKANEGHYKVDGDQKLKLRN